MSARCYSACRVLAALLLLSWASPQAAAQLVEALARIKPSVVAIGTYQRTRSPAFRFLATGFAVGNGLTIATNAHALPKSLDGENREQLVIAIPKGGGQTQIRPARRGAMDAEHDLVLLSVGGKPLPALVLAPDAAVAEGTEVGFTGFPIGSALGLTPVTHRGMVSALTPISIPQGNARSLDPRVLRSLKDPFMIYQLDATAYPGNSGSPLYDASGERVLGVINGVFVKGTKENIISDPSGISYAIPVRYLRTLLARQQKKPRRVAR